MPTEIEIVARTGERFGDFGPYVASINDAGDLAFYADDAIVAWRDGSLEIRPLPGVPISHPDIDAAGRICAYVRLAGGDTALALDDRIVDSGDIGPLGPTMNDRGQVAYRARGGVHLDGREVATGFAGLEGLPCVDESGAVVFRADRGIVRWRAGDVETVVALGAEFAELGRFPAVDPGGAVVFAAVDRAGQPGLWTVGGGGPRLLHPGGDFESVRGGLLCEPGYVVYATPPGGTIGVYACRVASPASPRRGEDQGGGHDVRVDLGRLFGVGDEIDGEAIAGFVLNPVSINRAGQLAVRLAFAGGAGAIARVDVDYSSSSPSGSPSSSGRPR